MFLARGGVALLALVWAVDAHALPPPRPGIVDPYTLRFRTTGQPVPVFPKEVRSPRPSTHKGRFPLAPRVLGRTARGARPLAVVPSQVPTLAPLVLLIDFVDRPSRSFADNVSISRLFFSPTAFSRKTVTNYWNEVSYGDFQVASPYPSPDNGVVGWLRAGDFSAVNSAPHIAGVSTASIDNVRILLDNVVSGLSAAGFDFSPYTRAADNTIQSVIIVHPGYGAEDSGNSAEDTYSHSARLATPIIVGLNRIEDYTIVPSVQYYSDPTKGNGADTTDDPLVGIGVIVHEMGHLLGLPDLYPTMTFGRADSAFSGVGVFDLMGYGLWGNPTVANRGSAANGADNPAHLSAWSKAELGWLVPSILFKATPGVPLYPVASVRNAYKIHPNGPGEESQFFLLENRRNDNTSVIFDKGLPLPVTGDGALVWRVDDERMDEWRASSAVPLSRSNTVNDDGASLALSLQEADLTNAFPDPHLLQPMTIGTDAFGRLQDFFVTGGIFSRTLPLDGQNRTNSSPTIKKRPSRSVFDVGFEILVSFLTSAAQFVISLVVELPYWDVFDTGRGLASNNVLSIAFDSAGRTWVGTADRGITILKPGALPKQISPQRSVRVQAMAYDAVTGSMWIGTDNSIEKVRLDQVQTIPALSTVGVDVRSIRVDRFLTKWVAGPRVLAAVTDAGNNQPSDIQYNTTSQFLEVGDEITCLAIDNVNATTRASDVLYVGTRNGKIYFNVAFDNSIFTLEGLTNLAFRAVPIPTDNSPHRIHAMEVDRAGILWVASDNGVFAFDRDPANLNPLLFNPFDLAGDNDLERIAYFNGTTTGFGPGSDTGAPVQSRGIAFQDVGQPPRVSGGPPRDVVWVAYGDNNAASTSHDGGALRIDAAVLQNPNVPKDTPALAAALLELALMKFTNAQGAVKGPVVNDLIAAAGDGISVWFGTNAAGLVRFGSGASLTLDRDTYLNDSAIATVTLVDEDLLGARVPSATVTVGSGVSRAGEIAVTLNLAADNASYTGTFGFSTSASDNATRKILVENLTVVTVTYQDSKPPIPIFRTAKWRSVFPFSDSLLIGGFSCFVATAAYGSPMAPEVETFRRFRDRFLARYGPGRVLVALYYRFSPPLAASIAGSGALRSAARACLAPAAVVAGFAVNAGAGEKGAVLVVVLLLAILPFRTSRRGGTGRF